MNARAPDPAPGRICPLDYRYAPCVFARRPEIEAAALYVAGGIYGNLEALTALEELVAAEPGAVLVLNGDFHWFDVEPGRFAAVDAIAGRHVALRGNVETEVGRGFDAATGCGRAYPDCVDQGVVERSNAIIARLAETASALPQARRFLGLPMHLVAAVGDIRIAIVHGDAEALAGWRFDRPNLDDPGARSWLARVRAESGVDIFASTHTCAPVMRRFALASGGMAVVNNGAAGLPNGEGSGAGLVTRIGVTPSPSPPLYGLKIGSAYVDALPLPYDHAAFLAAFDASWPEGSPAERSYRRRIVAGAGPDLMAAAAPR